MITTHTKASLDGVPKHLSSKVISFNNHSNDSSEIMEQVETHIGSHCMTSHCQINYYTVLKTISYAMVKDE